MMGRTWFMWAYDPKMGKPVPRLYYDSVPATAYSRSLMCVEIDAQTFAVIRDRARKRAETQPRGSIPAQHLIEELVALYPVPQIDID